MGLKYEYTKRDIEREIKENDQLTTVELCRILEMKLYAKAESRKLRKSEQRKTFFKETTKIELKNSEMTK